ncbi:MAG: ABC transporter permease subunit [Armatimonadota bacterium]|nr:ABC transporter permease subunit [Armatimonadota bacterium]
MSRRVSPGRALWLGLGAAYFIIPLVATMEFSLRAGGGRYDFSAYAFILNDPRFRESFLLSFGLALETIAVALVLLVPTVYWVHLRLPRLRPVVEFISVLPFVVPAIVLVVGLLDLYRGAPEFFVGTPQILVAGYVILALPYVYRALDAGMRAIDIHTLTEAAQSLGAGWTTTLFRVILPNLQAAVLSGAFITLAIVMGEFTLANVLLFNTFSVYINYIGETHATPAAALTLISFAITWVAMLGLLGLGRQLGGRQAQIGGAR